MARHTDAELIARLLVEKWKIEELVSDVMGGVVYRIFKQSNTEKIYLAPSGQMRVGVELKYSTRMMVADAQTITSTARETFAPISNDQEAA